MNKGSYAFAQMVQFLDEFVFLRIVKKYGGAKYVKHFSWWNQLLTLMFGQLTGKTSLRRFIIASAPIQSKFYSLGLGHNVFRSNLSKANNTHDHHSFEEFAYHTVAVAQNTPLYSLPFLSLGMTTRQCFVESSITMSNKTVYSFSLQMH